jgi:hypothetical protein
VFPSWIDTDKIRSTELLVRAWGSSSNHWHEQSGGPDGIRIWTTKWTPDSNVWSDRNPTVIFKCTAIIDATPKRVFDVIHNVAKMPTWYKPVLSK